MTGPSSSGGSAGAANTGPASIPASIASAGPSAAGPSPAGPSAANPSAASTDAPAASETAAPPSQSAASSGQASAAAPTSSIGKQPADTLAALQSVLDAEQAALWAYGLVAAVDPANASLISTMIINHQVLRDQVANLVVQGGATPVGPAPAYSTPLPATDTASALQLALTIEGDCAAAWRVLIGSTDDSGLRGTGLTGLTDSAMRMLTWRQQAKITPLTVAFPGGQ